MEDTQHATSGGESPAIETTETEKSSIWPMVGAVAFEVVHAVLVGMGALALGGIVGSKVKYKTRKFGPVTWQTKRF